MKIIPRAACAALLLAAGGCLSLGRPFPSDKVKAIVINKTTQTDIETAYGHPYRTGVEDGDVTWNYLDEHYSMVGQPRTKDLVLRFNADGTVKSYSFSTNE